jgi:hypothetical protein
MAPEFQLQTAFSGDRSKFPHRAKVPSVYECGSERSRDFGGYPMLARLCVNLVLIGGIITVVSRLI